MKTIILISQDSVMGGAQIRYLNLFNELCKSSDDYHLIINEDLKNEAIKRNILKSNTSNIISIAIPIGSKKTKNNSSLKITNNPIQKKEELFVKNKIRKLGNNLIELFRLIQITLKLCRIFINKRPKYVYGVWLGGMAVWPLKYIFRFKFVYSYMDSGFSSIYSGYTKMMKNERFPLKHADTIDFLSKNLYTHISKIVKLNPQTTISISPCSFKNYSTLFPSNIKQNIVTFCGRMIKIKNPILLLQSIALFNKSYERYADITFKFIGDGDLMNEMKLLISELALTNVELIGQVSNPEHFLKNSKVFVSIQQSNNYPSQSLLEAMACENAIIASDVGETEMIVSEKEGVLVNLDAKSISNAIIKLFKDEELLVSMASNARKKVLKEHNINSYLNYFHSLE